MAFKHFLGNLFSSCKHYYVCHYIKKGSGNCPLTQLIYKFKDGRQSAIVFWVNQCINLVDKEFPKFIDAETLIVRSLGSNETSVLDLSIKPLDQLGKALADKYGATYMPSAIYKTRKTKPMKSLNRDGRKQELNGVYKVNNINIDFSRYSKIVVLDDVLTTGTTVKYIIDELKNHTGINYSKFKVVTIAQTDTNIEFNKKLGLL